VTNRFGFWLPSAACGKPLRYMMVINNNNHNHNNIIRKYTYHSKWCNSHCISSATGLRFDDCGGSAVTSEEGPKCNYKTNYCPTVVSPSCIWYTYIVPIEILDFICDDNDDVLNEWLLTNRLLSRLGRPSHQSE